MFLLLSDVYSTSDNTQRIRATCVFMYLSSTWSGRPWTSAWAVSAAVRWRGNDKTCIPWRWVTVFRPPRAPDFYPLPPSWERFLTESSFIFPLWCFSHRLNLFPPHLVSKWTPCPPPPLSSVESDDWLLIAASPPFDTYVKLLVEHAGARSCHVLRCFPLADVQLRNMKSVYLSRASQDVMCSCRLDNLWIFTLLFTWFFIKRKLCPDTYCNL